MSDSNSSSSTSARGTLKLKVARKVSPPPAKPAPPPQQPARQTAQKFGAAWADEYKARMQADMDALATQAKD
jgi:hypothetical protein